MSINVQNICHPLVPFKWTQFYQDPMLIQRFQLSSYRPKAIASTATRMVLFLPAIFSIAQPKQWIPLKGSQVFGMRNNWPSPTITYNMRRSIKKIHFPLHPFLQASRKSISRSAPLRKSSAERKNTRAALPALCPALCVRHHSSWGPVFSMYKP